MRIGNTRTAAHASIPALIAVAVFGCTSQSDLEEVKRNLAVLKANQNDIKQNQRTILSKLDALDEKLGAPVRPATPAPAAAAAERAGRPDPNAVYAFRVGDSPSKGLKDAWVTVVEVSEFQ